MMILQVIVKKSLQQKKHFTENKTASFYNNYTLYSLINVVKLENIIKDDSYIIRYKLMH